MQGNSCENELWTDDEQQIHTVTSDLDHDIIQPNGRHTRWLRDVPWAAAAISFVAGGFLVGMWLWLSPSNSQENLGRSGAGVTQPRQDSNTGGGVANSASDDSMSESDRIMVDVKGDVRHPGVYTLPLNARARDAIRAAGGYVHPEDAAGVNEAMPLDDGMEFVVPNVQLASASSSAMNGSAVQSGLPHAGSLSNAQLVDKASAAQWTASNQQADAGQNGMTTNIANKIDLNTATESSLETVPGIGPKRAQAILSFRAAHGGFTSVSQLLQIRGIGPTLYRRISAYVIVNSVKNGQKP